MIRGYNFKHGHTANGASPTYRTWRGMHIRCTKPNHPKYHRYGGAGITICDKWKTFQGFLEDMGERPEGTSLDRIDSTLGYCKENCRWADIYTQNRHARRRRMVSYKGRAMPTVEWAKELGVDPGALYNRIQRGWSDSDIISKPFKKRSKSK